MDFARYDGDLKEIKTLFSITSEIIINKFSTNPEDTACDWNEAQERYEITLGVIIQEFKYYLIHEVGHILLAKRLQYPYFARTPTELKTTATPDQEVIFEFSNHIIDAFVDYVAFHEFEVNYPFFIEFMDALLKKGISSRADIIYLLKAYIYFSLQLRFVLKAYDRVLRRDKIQLFLSRLQHLIKLKSDRYSALLTKLDSKIDLFDTLKSSRDATEILNFMLNVLSELPLKNLDNTFKQWFPDGTQGDC